MKYIKTQQDLKVELSEQLDVLCDFCKQIDNGKLHYAKHLATLLRVLVHLTPDSKSLFYLLNKQHSMKFCSTGKTYPKYKDIIYLLTLITPARKFIVNGGSLESELVFVPNLNKNKNPMKWISFDKWYRDPVFIFNKESNDGLIMLEQKPGSKLVVSRSKIITYFANKDGGAHVDDQVNLDMYSLSKSLSSMEYEDIKPQTTYKPGEKYVPGIPIQNSLHAALRQIAYEIITTIHKEFGLQPSYNPSHQNILGYEIGETHDHCVRFNPSTRQVSTTY